MKCLDGHLFKRYSFLEGPKIALTASRDFDDGHYKTQPHHGMRAFGRVYSAWAYGQTVSNLYFRPPMFIVRLTLEFSGIVISNTFTVESEPLIFHV